MFTGLVQALAIVQTIESDGHGGARLTIIEPNFARVAVLGESIAVNGACLTMTVSDAVTIRFDCGPETLAKTTLGSLTTGDSVNLERALRVGDALGGHWVTGHIDCVGRVHAVEPNGEWKSMAIDVPAEFDELLVVKGSVTVDGVSLTLVTVEPGRITIMLIPHTLTATTLSTKVAGDSVNLEFDLIAKHVRKLFRNLSIEL